jgi:HSP20 family protein
MVTLREAMNSLFDDSYVSPLRVTGAPTVGGNLAVDIYESSDGLVVKAAIPGMNPEDLDITVTGDVLNIKGETKQEEEIKEENYHRREFRYGSFCRSVRLPVEVDSSKAEATYKDGVLTLAFPKPEGKKPLSISVKAANK